MTTIERTVRARQLYFHDPSAPAATAVVPAVVVAVRWSGGRLLLVRRCDSGSWELPGGPIAVGESAVDAALRHAAQAAGVRLLVTDLLGLFADPRLVQRSGGGEVSQLVAILFGARCVGGVPRGDGHETSDAAWIAVADLPGLPMEPSSRAWVEQALAVGEPPCLG